MLQVFKQWARRRFPRVFDLLRSTIFVLRTLPPRRFAYILYRADGCAEPVVHDPTIEVVESGQPPTTGQRAYMRRDLFALSPRSRDTLGVQPSASWPSCASAEDARRFQAILVAAWGDWRRECRTTREAG